MKKRPLTPRCTFAIIISYYLLAITLMLPSINFIGWPSCTLPTIGSGLGLIECKNIIYRKSFEQLIDDMRRYPYI